MANIILTNISRLRLGALFRNYASDDMEVIRGRYTNEAPVKYLISSICKSNPEVKCTIVAITTREAEEAFKAFRKSIRGYCRRNGYNGLKIEPVTFDERNFGLVISDIIQKIHKDDRVFIDTTGGFRDSVYLLMAVVRILEYSGIRLEKAVYAAYNEKMPRDNRIIDITDTYKMFNLINAANSFTSLGNSDELARFFAGCGNDDIIKAIDVMNRFSDEVALCRTSKLDMLMTELNEILMNIQHLNTTNENEILFKSISGVIRDKFGVNDGEKIDYIDVIRWCLDNKMIQQAVTIYVEKMPEFIFTKGLITCRTELLDTTRFSKNFDDYYNMLYNGFLQQTSSITLSPYPLGNFLSQLKRDRPSVYKELCVVGSINDFSIKDQLTSDERKGVLNLIRVRNAIFSEPHSRRSAEDVESRRRNTKLRDLADSGMFDTAATSTEAFVNSLLKNKDYLRQLQGEFTPYTPRVWCVSDINVVEHLERVLAENNRIYSLGSRITCEDIKNVLKHLVYVKRYVRNSLNHASEENRLVDEYDEYFGSRGYNVSSELTVGEIEAVIREAITLIRKLTI